MICIVVTETHFSSFYYYIQVEPCMSKKVKQSKSSFNIIIGLPEVTDTLSQAFHRPST
jgi:hypothetical protein